MKSRLAIITALLALVSFYGTTLYGSMHFYTMESTHLGVADGSICPMRGGEHCPHHQKPKAENNHQGHDGHDMAHSMSHEEKADSGMGHMESGDAQTKATFLKCNCKHFYKANHAVTFIPSLMGLSYNVEGPTRPLISTFILSSGTAPAPPEKPPRG